MFSLGLEFSFNKLKQVGNTAFIATIVEIAGLLSLGYGAGTLMGWSHMNSLFLGGMLSMSSTTIIIKAFEDLKMKGKRFTEMVFGILIVEDIAGIIMMVLLSTLGYYHDGSAFHTCCISRHFRHGAFGQRYAPAVLSDIVVCAWHLPCAYLL